MTNTLSIVYFPAAVALGALHALEPGHAKALTAAYLIGIKGTKTDSILLGLSVAATHSLVVIAISAVGLWLGNEAFSGNAASWLERGSGLVAISIGAWMLWRRLGYGKGAHTNAHSHEAVSIPVAGNEIAGTISIINTPQGERMQLETSLHSAYDTFTVEIDRPMGRKETLLLSRTNQNQQVYLSARAPAEPHEFQARILANRLGEKSIEFSVHETEHHHDHDHAHMDDIEHAKAHAETLPDYVHKGERPSLGQILLFGAAGGMIPCPASITVMLLALSTGRAGIGVLTVLGFSLGLAISLVGIGLIVVTGLSKLSDTGRFTWLSRKAPVISAALVMLSGVFALAIAH